MVVGPAFGAGLSIKINATLEQKVRGRILVTKD